MADVTNQNVNSLLNKLNSLDFTSSSASSATSVRNELDTLFTDIGTMNEGTDGAKKIERQIESLEKKIKELEDAAAKIVEDIDGKDADVKKNQAELVKSASELDEATLEFQEQSAQAARYAAEDAIYAYKNGDGDSTFQQCFDQAYRKRLGGLQANQAVIQQLWQVYEQNKSNITSITDAIQAGLDKITNLEGQLKNVQGTISVLTRTKSIMEQSQIQDAYKNIDTDANVPIFSGKKAEVANEILNAGYVKDTGNNGNNAAKTAKEVQDSWLSQKEGNYKKGTDKKCQSKNPELKNLGQLIEKGMLDSLSSSGMSIDEIMTFISKNWDVGLKKKDGTWNIPYGHTTKGHKEVNDKEHIDGSQAIYDSLAELVKGQKTYINADTANQDQVSGLKTAVEKDGVLKKMYEAGFTFKEAMYTLTQAFPDAGINYDLDSQSNKRNYSLVKDSSTSGNLYKTIGEQVLQYWNVGADEATKKDDSTNGKVKQYDPITFQDGTKSYTFIQDRDNDGKFDYDSAENNELLGSKNGIEELKAYDLDGDGKISGEELKNLNVMINDQQESVGNSKDVDKYKKGKDYTNSVDFNVSYSTAYDLGITEIDLNSLEEGSKDYKDINGSELANTLNIKTDGSKLDKSITAKETNNTASNLDTFYGQIAKDANASTMSSKLTDKEFNELFEKAEGSEVIENAKKKLTTLKEEHSTDFSYGGTTLTEEDIHNITGLAYITGAMEAARVAAEAHIDNISDAKDSAEEANNDYFETRVFGKNGVKETDEDEKKK